jgi:hypothetical protein
MLGRASPPISLRERETTSSSHRGAGNRRTTPCGQRRRAASYSSSGSAFLICRLTSPGLIPGPTNWFPVTSATASASSPSFKGTLLRTSREPCASHIATPGPTSIGCKQHRTCSRATTLPYRHRQRCHIAPGHLHPPWRASYPAFFARALDRPAFFGARWSRAAGLRRSPPARSVSTLRRSASMRLTTLEGSRSRGASILWPDCFFFSSSFSASSY